MNEVKKHSMGMIIIGGFVWLLYLGYVNLLTIKFGVPHLVSEGTGIPLSWVANYGLNTVFNFRQPINAKRFFVFCTISGVGWGVYLFTTFICTDVIGWYSAIGTVLGAGTKTAMNVIMQQSITFGTLGERDKENAQEAVSREAGYDWHAYYHGNPIQKWWKHRLGDKALAAMACVENPVADIGCGSSPNLSMIQAKEKYGLDMDGEKIKFIQEKDPTSRYREAKGEDTGFPDNYCSAVMCLEVIEHHPDPFALMKELSRITKVGGTVVIGTPDFSSPVWNIIEVVYGLVMRSGYHLEHGSKFTESAVIALGKGVGLEWVKTDKVAGADMVITFKKGEVL